MPLASRNAAVFTAAASRSAARRPAAAPSSALAAALAAATTARSSSSASSRSALFSTRTSTATVAAATSATTTSFYPSRRGLASAASAAKVYPDVTSSALQTTLTSSPKPIPENKTLVFGHTFADHMLTIEWDGARGGFAAPQIQPYGKIALEPCATVFHYAIECFEGMKAYKDKQGRVRLFRPDKNMDRFWKSCERLGLPTFDKAEMLECIKQLVRVDQRWIPSERGYSLYIRPTAIATQESLGVGVSNKALFFTITCPVGPYYKTGFSAVALSATSHYVRAWPGGTGDSKLGANYASGIRPQLEVARDGFQQNLWLFGADDRLTEVGTMNLFVFWTNPTTGRDELVTPPLDGTILPGVTRASILEIARGAWKGEFDVAERSVTMPEVVRAVEEGRLKEMFGAGTAAIVSPIKAIRYKGQDVQIPLDPADPAQQAGPLTRRIADYIMGVQYGEIVHEDWSVVL
ncbi:aminotransferase [Zopfochytrium polystomum]|nr:aminotransferase [Zopfochytrium polystomum]